MEREPVVILDDGGEEHEYNILKITSLKAIKLLNRFQQTGTATEMIDQLVDAAMAEFSGYESEGDPIDNAINAAAHRIISAGDSNLITDLLLHADRDGVKLTKSQIELVFQGNLGEMQRALAAVLRESYSGFFVERVVPLRAWGQRLVKQMKTAFPKVSKTEFMSTLMSGLSSKSGINQKGEQASTKSSTVGT